MEKRKPSVQTFTIGSKEFCTSGYASVRYGVSATRLMRLVDRGKVKRFEYPLLCGYPLYSIEELENLTGETNEVISP